MRLFCLLFLAGLISLSSCNKGGSQKKGIPVARVRNAYLYTSDLAGVVPANTPSSDSVEMVKNYIQNWIRQKLVVHQAEQNLSKDQKDFSLEMEDYRNSLVVYKYESKLIEQKLDTNVSEKEIEDYYQANPANFELKDNIVKVLYVKLPLKNSSLNRIRNLLKSSRDNDKEELVNVASTQAVNSFLDDNTWLFFNDLLKEIPIKTYDQEEYLQNHRFVEFSDDQYTYLMNILDFKIKEGLSPLSLEKENIRNILINKRKIKLVNDMEKDVYEQALKDKEFEIF
ncbi:MAG: hypothetical protein AB9842_12615 [Bacteroidales bacterium]